jgi:hypothetical protein
MVLQDLVITRSSTTGHKENLLKDVLMRRKSQRSAVGQGISPTRKSS